MEASMNLESAIYLGVAGLMMAVAAFMLGRRTSASISRQLELEAEVSNAHREQARSEAEAERLRNELDAGRQEYDEYRLNVVDHFSGTSDLLRDLTGQYRAVYEHLTKGASTLCPEGFVGLTEGLPPPQLAEAPADLEGELAAASLDAATSDADTDATAESDLSALDLDDSNANSRPDEGTDFDSEETLSVPTISS
jgi:hypothetical protein